MSSSSVRLSSRSIDGNMDKYLDADLDHGSSVDILAALSLTDPVYLNSVVDYQKALVPSHVTVKGDIINVLILFTGGTIGMKANAQQGYVPVMNWFYESLSRIARFHDTEFAQRQPEILREVVFQSCRYSLDYKKSTSSGLDDSAADYYVESRKQNPLITPLTLYGKRIKYNLLEYDPLLDSANMTMSDWVKIATDIELNYDSFDAFVVVHGTDTMSYTSSALSFMLEDLGKTVIITGSQVPLAEWRTDAEENLLCSLLMASHFVIPEVCLYFGNKLFRGNRTTKLNALDFVAFDSPNLKPLADTGVNITVNWMDIRPLNRHGKFHAHKDMNPNVATLRIFPGITSSTVKAFLSAPIQGVIFLTYGAGNFPTTRTDILKLIKEACDRGIVIVNCTQCKKGYVSDLYATGKALAALGVVPGGDMTPECALTKLSYLLGKNRSASEVRILMQRNLRGEMSNLSTMRPMDNYQFISVEEHESAVANIRPSSPFFINNQQTYSALNAMEDLQSLLMPVFLDISPQHDETAPRKCKALMRVIIPGERYRKGVVTTGKTFEEAKQKAAQILHDVIRDSFSAQAMDSLKKRKSGVFQ